MVGFVKDKKTFITKSKVNIGDFDIFLRSSDDDTSKVMVYGGDSNERDLLFIEDLNYIGIIFQVENDSNKNNISLINILNLFDQDFFYTNETQTGSIEDFLKTLITNKFINGQDNYYNLPYLVVNVNTQTNESCTLDVDNNGIFNIKNYIKKVQKLHNIFCTFEVTKNKLIINISKKNLSLKNIDFSDRTIELLEDTFSDTNVAKITVKNVDTSVINNYYLLSDGTFTTNSSASNRVYGEWTLMTISNNDDVSEKLNEEFLKNEYSHKILFSIPKSKARFDFYDKVSILLNNKLFNSIISKIEVKNNDDRIYYQSGELKTTLTDKLIGVVK